MLLKTLQESQTKLDELVQLAAALEQAGPDDLTRLKASQSAVAIAIKVEQLRLQLVKHLNGQPPH